MTKMMSVAIVCVLAAGTASAIEGLYVKDMVGQAQTPMGCSLEVWQADDNGGNPDTLWTFWGSVAASPGVEYGFHEQATGTFYISKNHWYTFLFKCAYDVQNDPWWSDWSNPELYEDDTERHFELPLVNETRPEMP